VISLIHAWPKVVNICPTAKLSIFGKDGRTDAGESMRDFLLSSLPASIRNTVDFPGHVEQADLRNALRAASVAVFPSYSEGFAMAPMEAMAEACPTIYSRRGSGAELIQDGENGLLVDPAQPTAIAHAITKILSDANLAARLGSAGREHVARCFSTSVLLAKNISFYQASAQSFRSTCFKRAKAA
jgi:glycosyltransferase involved in cell wall biosynthesis